MCINGNKNYIDNRERERERERERGGGERESCGKTGRGLLILIDGGTFLVIQFLGDNTEILPVYN